MPVASPSLRLSAVRELRRPPLSSTITRVPESRNSRASAMPGRAGADNAHVGFQVGSIREPSEVIDHDREPPASRPS